eukprot:5470797-Lingulodinium_polyedra.AAC.1
MPLLAFVVFDGGGPLAPSARDAGVGDRELATRVLEVAIDYDQVQRAEVVALEVITRKAQSC